MNAHRSIPTAIRAGVMIALLGGTGCGLFPGSSDGGTSTTATGFGQPTIEVTINTVHFGPSAPNAASTAVFSTTTDPTTLAVLDSTLNINVSSGTGASCALAIHRQGNGVAPIGLMGYTLDDTEQNGATVDGDVEAVGTQSMTVPQGTWQCSGSSCNGTSFAITGLDSVHIEGFMNGGAWDDFASGTTASAVCAFYIPITTTN